MNALPVVAICGRPNVGKSTLFNVLAGRRISIVDPTSGVTRDRIATTLQIDDKHCELIDTGGIGLEEDTPFGEAVTHQAEVAIETAELILLVVDIREGVTPLDMRVAEILRKHQKDKKIWLLANKTDSSGLEKEKEPFHKLGFGSPFCISTAHAFNIGELKESLYEFLAAVDPVAKSTDEEVKIAVVGRTNAGKSTFINSLAKQERVIVSEVPGTTRDSIDVRFEKDGKSILAIDTAGLKRKKNLKDNVDFYSQHRAQKSIRRADIVVFMFDASTKISKIDKQLADYVRTEYKPTIVVVNKWDLAKDVATPEAYEHYLAKTLPALAYAPLIFVTAKTGRNVSATIDLARSLYKQANQRIATGELNRVVGEITAKKSPPTQKGRQGKVFYATQAGICPPTFVFFVNSSRFFTGWYRRYLFNKLQIELKLPEVPLKLEFRGRSARSFQEH